jgi:predicted Zn-dependent protease
MDPKKRRLAIIGTCLAVGMLAFFLAIPFMSGFLGRFVPHSVQDPIGKKVVDSTRGKDEWCTAPEGLAALDSLVDKLAAKADHDTPFRVYVIDGDVLNAFAAPGGHLVIYREIIDRAHDPNELAGVLAHEMAHEVEGHPASGLVETLGYGIFSLLTPGSGDIGSDIAASVVTSKFSRDDELEADASGIALLNAAGIDSRGLARFFDTMAAEGNEIPGALEFLSTHPTGENRQAQVANLQKEGTPALDDAQWQALRGVCKVTSTTASPVGT